MKIPLKLTWTRLRQTIGNFGWLDTPAPHATVVIWVLAAAVLVIVALVFHSRRRYALIFLGVVIVALPLFLESPKLNSTGTYWQGRYWLPLIMGNPLVASTVAIPGRRIQTALRTRRSSRALAVGVVAVGDVLIAGQIDAFATMLRRYDTGLGPGPHVRPRWSPPGGSGLLTALFVIGEAVLLGIVAWQATTGPGDRVATGPIS